MNELKGFDGIKIISDIVGFVLQKAGQQVVISKFDSRANDTEERKIRQFSEKTEDSIDLPMTFEERQLKMST